jgi:hypothetical protein
MRRALFTIVCCSLLLTVIASAQGRKPGLWEMTSTMNMQGMPQAPQPPAEVNGHPVPQMGGGAPFGGPHTSQVCVTQAQLDKYHAIVGLNGPQQHDCQITNIVPTANGMTGEMVCTGRMTGKGTVQSSWSDSEHASGTIHFTGTVQMGPNTKPIEWTNKITSVFKSADCGSVKPFEPPAAK